jgi:hypothetical protein
MNNIIVDVDGIILDFNTSYLEYLLSKHNINVPNNSMYIPKLWELLQISKEEYLEKYYYDFILNNLPPKLPEIPNAFNCFNILSEVYHIYLITAIDARIKEHRINNLRGLNYTELIFDKDKQKYIDILQPSMIFEDSVEYIKSYLSNPKFIGVMFCPDYGYNLGIKGVEYYKGLPCY